jgi:hypothetical protein
MTLCEVAESGASLQVMRARAFGSTRLVMNDSTGGRVGVRTHPLHRDPAAVREIVTQLAAPRRDHCHHEDPALADER